LAIAECSKAIKLNPNLDVPYLNRGLAYKEQGSITEAMADFRKFLTLTNNPQLIERARQEIEELSE
jgi:regulator of sirC expression with transglutaminase-like and TPR domain